MVKKANNRIYISREKYPIFWKNWAEFLRGLP
jgi:hypothetical protein